MNDSEHDSGHDHEHSDHEHGHAEHRHDHEATHSQDGVRHTLRIVVPAAAMEERALQVARAYRGRARLPGFRRGKAPLAMVRQQFEDEIRQHVLDHSIPELVRHELDDRGLQPLESPELAGVEFAAGQPLDFTVRFDTAPEITIRSLEVSATRPAVEVTDEMVDESLGQLRERAARLVPADDGATVTAGMFARCAISLLAKDGKGKKLAEEDRFVHVGEEKAIPGLNAQLEGLAVGDEREFITELADGFPNEILAGKEVRCRVAVNELKRRELPDLDDDFAGDLGFDDLAALRAASAEDLRLNMEHQAERSVDSQLLEDLRGNNPVDVPESLVERRLDEMTRRFASDLAAQGVDPRGALDWSAFRSENRTGAAASIADEMLLDRIADDVELSVEEDKVEDEIRRQLESGEGGKSRPAASVVQQMRKDGSFEALRLTMRRRLALEHLRGRATIEVDGGEKASVSGPSEGAVEPG